jgi:hypothetical protein
MADRCALGGRSSEARLQEPTLRGLYRARRPGAVNPSPKWGTAHRGGLLVHADGMRRGGPRPWWVRWAGLRGDPRGASSVEYIIFAGCIALLVLVSWHLFGQRLVGMLAREGHDVTTLTPECLYCDRSGTASAVPAIAETAVARTTANGERAPPSSSGSSASRPPSSRPSSPAVPPWIGGILNIMCPQDKAFLRQLKNNGVQITAYDRIYFEDPFYNGRT